MDQHFHLLAILNNAKQTLVYKYLFQPLSSVLVDLYLGEEFLSNLDSSFFFVHLSTGRQRQLIPSQRYLKSQVSLRFSLIAHEKFWLFLFWSLSVMGHST